MWRKHYALLNYFDFFGWCIGTMIIIVYYYHNFSSYYVVCYLISDQVKWKGMKTQSKKEGEGTKKTAHYPQWKDIKNLYNIILLSRIIIRIRIIKCKSILLSCTYYYHYQGFIITLITHIFPILLDISKSLQ